jgi:hypothetical protein
MEVILTVVFYLNAAPLVGVLEGNVRTKVMLEPILKPLDGRCHARCAFGRFGPFFLPGSLRNLSYKGFGTAHRQTCAQYLLGGRRLFFMRAQAQKHLRVPNGYALLREPCLEFGRKI